MAIDILNMSDDELMNLDPNTLLDEASDSGKTEGGSGNTEGGNTEGTGDTGTESDSGTGSDAGQGSEGSSEGTGEGQGDAGVVDAASGQTTGGSNADLSNQDDELDKDPGKSEGTASAPAAKTEGGSSVSDQTGKPTTEVVVDFKAEYEKLLAPFTANGRQIAAKTVDEARTLMQMGANYNKKMAAIKPNLKLLKLLETNGLMSEEKISFLIDLEKKNPDAINKLIKDSGIDPMEIDTEKAGTYSPTKRTVDDREIDLDTVLEDLSGSSTYQRTIGIVANEWDSKSKQTVANAPELLRVIDSHVESGIYDIIQAEVDRQRVFGSLKGLSDIEAYRQVGDSIDARGGFDHLNKQRQQTAPAANTEVKPKPKKVNEEEIKDKRRAASAAKPTATPAKATQEFNPLALSDDEFSKLVRPGLM